MAFIPANSLEMAPVEKYFSKLKKTTGHHINWKDSKSRDI